jgi:4-hydroxy-2-oxoheptanedioate aldolase
MGHENRWQEAPVQKAIERGLRAVADAGKCAGVLALDNENRQTYAGWGARYFANVASSLIMKAFEQAAGAQTELRY